MAAREEEDTLALSFLDVLCCGLGATIYLFLVFSVLPHTGEESGASASPAAAGKDRSGVPLGARWEVSDAPVVSALTRIHVRSVSPLAAGEVEFPELPHGKFDSYSTPDMTAPWTYVVTVPRGLPPDRDLTFTVASSALARFPAGASFRVTVWVGSGVREQTITAPLPNPRVSGAVSVFRVRLSQVPDEWISPAN